MARKQTDQEIMGVLHGEKFAREQLGLKPIQLDHHKGSPHGFDAVYRNPKSGNLVVVDFKGGPCSKLKTNQKQAAYISKAADRTLRSRTATLKEKRAARLIKGNLERGKKIEFMAIKTSSPGKTRVSDHTLTVKAANAQSSHRFKANHNQTSNRIGNTTISKWQKNPPRQLSRKPANDNARTQKPNSPKPSPSPQQSPKRSR